MARKDRIGCRDGCRLPITGVRRNGVLRIVISLSLCLPLSGCVTSTILASLDCATSGMGFGRDDGKVTYSWCQTDAMLGPTGSGSCTLDHADPRSFRSLGNKFGADNYSVFYGCYPLTGARPEGFVPPDTWTDLTINHHRAGNQILWFNHEWRFVALVGVDVDTFQVLDTHYSRDANTVWYGPFPIRHADPASFEVIPSRRGHAFARDKRNVYKYRKIVPGADPETFQVPVGSRP